MIVQKKIKINFIIIIVLGFCFYLLSFKPGKNNTGRFDGIENDSLFKIYKIDSINSYYLIYAKKSGRLYKIVSKKSKNCECYKIKTNEEYYLEIESMKGPIVVNGKTIQKMGSFAVKCIILDDSTKVCLEMDSIRDLSRSKNIKGLCLINE